MLVPTAAVHFVCAIKVGSAYLHNWPIDFVGIFVLGETLPIHFYYASVTIGRIPFFPVAGENLG